MCSWGVPGKRKCMKNVPDYEKYLEKTKCRHKKKVASVHCIDREKKRYGIIYHCEQTCAEFYLYPHLHPIERNRYGND